MSVDDSQQAASATPAGSPRMLDYSTPRNRRPGIVTAVGIISIIVASLGLLRSSGQLLFTAGMLLAAQVGFTPGAGSAVTDGATLSPEDIETIISALDPGQALPTGDRQMLATALAGADLPLASPPPGQPWTQQHVTQQFTFATGAVATRPATTRASDGGAGRGNVRRTGTTTFNTAGGTITIGQTVVITASLPTGGVSTTTLDARGSMSRVQIATNMVGALSLPAALASLAAELFHLGLSVLLLVAGILALRASSRSPVLHRRWAWLKLLAIALGTAVGIWASLQMWDSAGMRVTTTTAGGAAVTTNPMAGVRWAMVAQAVVMALIGCIYPIVVLVVHRLRQVRAYYAGLD